MIIGIDPGARGGVAGWDIGFGASVFPYSASELISRQILPTDTVYVEKVGAMPGNGSVSMFNFGFGCGVIEGVILAKGAAINYIRPQAWKKAVLGAKYPHDKEGAIAFCKDNYPEVNLILPRCRTPHDGIADAVCIMHYGRMQHLGLI